VSIVLPEEKNTKLYCQQQQFFPLKKLMKRIADFLVVVKKNQPVSYVQQFVIGISAMKMILK